MILVGLTALLVLGMTQVPEVTANPECQADTCSGNGVCFDYGNYNRTTCSCNSGFQGTNCAQATNILNCDWSPENIVDQNAVIITGIIPNRTECVTRIVVHSANVINVTVLAFDFEAQKDSLEVGSGLFLSGDEYDNNRVYNTTQVKTNYVYYLVFTDKNINSTGYHFVISADGDDCLSVDEPCLNGGTCIDEWQNYTCACPVGYTGQICDIVVDDCDSAPCQNGGTCNSIDTGGYTCTCTESYTGIHCETGIVIVDNTTPFLLGSSEAREGITSQSLSFDLTFSPSPANTYSIFGGSGLWQVSGFFSSGSNGVTAFGGGTLSLTAAQQATVWNPPSDTTISSILATSVSVPSNALCSDMQYFCARIEKGPSPSPDFVLMGDPGEAALVGCTSITCRGVEITGSSLSIVSGTLRDGLSGQTIVVNFDLESNANGGGVSGSNLWRFGAYGSRNSVGSLPISFSIDITPETSSIGVVPGVTSQFNGLSLSVDLSGGNDCDDVPYICVVIAKSVPTASPDFTLTTIPNDDVLTACSSITCTGVQISDTSLDITSGDLLEGVSQQSVTFNFGMTPSSISGAVSGSNLWALTAFGSADAFGSSIPSTTYTVNLGQQGNLGVSPGSVTTFSGVNFQLDLSGDVNCDDVPYICVRVDKGSSPNPDFSFSGVTEDVLTSCQQVTCRDVDIASTTTAVTGGTISDGQYNSVPFSVTLNPSSNSGTAIGQGLWMITAFASQSPNGFGTRYDEMSIGLTLNQAATTLNYNSPATIDGLTYILDLSNGPDCSMFSYICTELERGLNPAPAFTLTPASTISCFEVNCAAVEIIASSLSAPSFVREGQNNDVTLSISLTSDPDSSTASGERLWQVTAFASSSPQGDGTRYDEQSLDVTTFNQEDTTLGPGVPTTIGGLQYSLDTSDGPTCSQFDYICVEIEKGDNPSPDFVLQPTSIIECSQVDCRGVDISQLSITLESGSDEVFHGQTDNIIMDIYATANGAYGSIAGDNLWTITAWLSNNQFGSGTRLEEDTLNLNQNLLTLPVNSGSTAIFMNAEFFVDLTVSPTCTQFNYVCVELERNSGATVDFELTGDLMACTPITCTDVNECGSFPCLNGGTCNDLVNGYTCTCRPGFTGDHCGININECASIPCQNGGTCFDQINGYRCSCVPGYTGTNCETDIDECASNPCLNNAVCSDRINSYLCTCLSGFTGPRCETNINECDSLPCQNGGTCTDYVNYYQCQCLPGFTGIICEININECASIPCQNGGTCNDGINMYTCNCAPGFTGTYCEIDINECSSNPCSQGSCINRVNEYECVCFPGYTGTNCDININECSSVPCQNGGTCIDQVNQYTCNCQPGYTGTHCEININECISGPCQNGGTCTDGVNQYTCNCQPGYTGTRCEININECLSGPCLNGGTCWDGVNSYTCQCAAGFTGTRCEININECASSPCLNGGTCVDGNNMFSCLCTSEWTGTRCEISLNACRSNPCQYGGTCVNTGTSYVCECYPGYAGTNCEININECSSLPCQNGGQCIDGVAMYTCQCSEGFSGVNCEAVGYCNLAGEWYNELNDKITISLTSTGMFLGDYKSNIELLTGYSAPTVVVGYANQNCAFPSFGFVITRDNGKSTTSWSGQCHLCDGEEVLYTTWTNTERVTTCAAVKRATLVGTDKWTRYQQSTAPREDV